ncbi:MAG: hypothetical protein ACJASR_002613, partial [Psychroserpens sp.]
AEAIAQLISGISLYTFDSYIFRSKTRTGGMPYNLLLFFLANNPSYKLGVAES